MTVGNRRVRQRPGPPDPDPVDGAGRPCGDALGERGHLGVCGRALRAPRRVDPAVDDRDPGGREDRHLRHDDARRPHRAALAGRDRRGRRTPAWPGGPPLVLVRAYATAGALRAAGAQVVILLSHLGLAYDQAIAANQPAPLIDFVWEATTTWCSTSPSWSGARGSCPPAVLRPRRPPALRRRRTPRHVPGLCPPAGKPVPPARPLGAGAGGRPQGADRGVLQGGRLQAGDRLGPPGHPAGCSPGRPARDTAMGNLIADAYRFKTHSDVGLVASGYVRPTFSTAARSSAPTSSAPCPTGSTPPRARTTRSSSSASRGRSCGRGSRRRSPIST